MGVFLMSWTNRLSKIARCLLGKKYAEKLIMIANILCHDWHTDILFSSDFHYIFYNTSDEEVIAGFPKIDPESLAEILRYVRYQRDFFITRENYGCFFFNYPRLYGKEDIMNWKNVQKKNWKILKEYKFTPSLLPAGPESLVCHHGLIFCSSSVKNYIKEGFFLDVGGCFGDSALIFLKHYNPSKVISFEPSAPNREIYKSVMQRNHINESQYELSAFALGKECTSIYYTEKQGGGNTIIQTENGKTKVEITTLDKFCSDRKISNIRLIKADVEGMGLDMLLGSEKTIRKNRPVLNLSIYHNRDELLKIYKTLYEWQLDYQFMIRNLSLVTELTLIAWPKELDQLK